MSRRWRSFLAAFALLGLGASAAGAQEQMLRWTVAVLPEGAKPGTEVEVVFTADIAKGWILYSSDFELEIGPRPAKFTFDAASGLELLGPVQAVGSKRKKDAALGTEYTYFSGRAEFRQKARLASGAESVAGRIDGQTCFEESGLCELFSEKFAAKLSVGTPSGVGAVPVSAPSSSAARVELGRRLFFDPILSKDRTVSCASCHKPEHAFADDVAVSAGVGGKIGTRNTPSVMNVSGRTTLFWDGRAETLEEQALFPIANPVEMALPVDEALQRLNADATYAKQFQEAFGQPATARTLGRAFAAFQKTLDTIDSPYDRYAHGDDGAISESARRGRLLFIGRAKCADCHSGEDFTSDRFRNIGLFDGGALGDRGRGAITNRPEDDGQFKVPSLRNVSATAPYMHNGMFRTLREVIDYYNEPDKVVPAARGRDASMNAQIQLTEGEKRDLEAFLQALTDDRFASVKAPGERR